MNEHAIVLQEPMTVEAFLAYDGGGHQGKLELVEGRVRAMAPASDAHSTIQGNLCAAIHAHLKSTGSRCRVGTEPPVIPPFQPKINARAADIAVTCTPPSDRKVFEDPILIVEVMSPSNEKETWESIHAIANAASLKEVAIVQSTVVDVQVCTRAANGAWPDAPVSYGAGETVHMTSLSLDIAIADIYANTLLQSAAQGPLQAG